MPIPKLPLNDGKRTIAYNGVVAFLKADPTLKRVVATWRTWDGSPNEDQLPDSIDQCPWVRLTPEFGAAQRIAAPGAGPTMVQNDLTLTVETAVAGTRSANSEKLWAAFEWALMPDYSALDARRAADAALEAVGLTDCVLVRPAIVANAAGLGLTIARGAFAFNFTFDL